MLCSWKRLSSAPTIGWICRSSIFFYHRKSLSLKNLANNLCCACGRYSGRQAVENDDIMGLRRWKAAILAKQEQSLVTQTPMLTFDLPGVVESCGSQAIPDGHARA